MKMKTRVGKTVPPGRISEKEQVQLKKTDASKKEKYRQGKKKRRRRRTSNPSGGQSKGLSRKRKIGRDSKKRIALQKKKSRRRLFRDLLLAIGISSLLLSLIIGTSIRFPSMNGFAMLPTAADRDRLVVNKWKKIKRFSLVYFKEPIQETYTVRRVIGLPGEHLAYKNDELYVDTKLVPERFLDDARATAKTGGYLLMQDWTLEQLFDSHTIPDGKYLVLGDNRQFASDSRNYGLIDASAVVGVVELRILPFHTARYF